LGLILKCADEPSRRAALSQIIAVAIGALVSPAWARGPSPNVLFICQFGTAKSAVAREVFRKRAKKRGISVTAFSRGITPEEHVSPALRRQLAADGIDSTADGVAKLTRADIDRADIIVAFNPIPNAFKRKGIQNWSSLPSMNDSYPAARTDLARRIDALLDVIAGKR
jgi:galactitol-specific phosphotransferase system IIB component